jgi:2-dehydro-3-deoxyphosphogalactonate aldolase
VSKNPLIIAILRGIRPSEVDAVVDALIDAGIRVIEVPLNSPEPLLSIERLRQRCGSDCVIGAGTVLNRDAVESCARSGAEFIVAPNVDVIVISHAIACGLGVVPGFASASEALTAYAAGARLIKLFPAASYGPAHVRALRSVFPPELQIIAVGGVGAATLPAWRDSGIVGIGVGSELYRPGMSAADVGRRASTLLEAATASLPATDPRWLALLRPGSAAASPAS